MGRQQQPNTNLNARLRWIFGVIIVATIPFYVAGAIAYFLAPPETQTVLTRTAAPPATVDATQPAMTTQAPTQTPFRTATSPFFPSPTATLGLGFPTSRPTERPSATPSPTTPAPTNTPLATNTPAATNTPPPPQITDTPLPFD